MASEPPEESPPSGHTQDFELELESLQQALQIEETRLRWELEAVFSKHASQQRSLLEQHSAKARSCFRKDRRARLARGNSAALPNELVGVQFSNLQDPSRGASKECCPGQLLIRTDLGLEETSFEQCIRPELVQLKSALGQSCTHDDISGTSGDRNSSARFFDSGSPVTRSHSLGRLRTTCPFSRNRSWRDDYGMGDVIKFLEKQGGTSYPIRCIDWYMTLKEPPRQDNCLHRLLYGTKSTALCILVIFLNAMFEAYETDIEISSYNKGATRIVIFMDLSFLTFYCIEIALKFALHRGYFFANTDVRWNIFDLCLVMSTLVEHVLQSFAAAHIAADVKFMRSMRILKLAKALHVVRMFRFITEFRLIMNSVLGCLLSFFWSFVVLLFIIYIWALVFVKGVASFLRESHRLGDMDPVLEEELLIWFGSTRKSMLALYMAVSGGDDWHVIYSIVEHTGPRNAVIFLIYILFIQIAVMNIVTGMFVENAMKLAEPDRADIALRNRKAYMAEAAALEKICRDMDKDKNGGISEAEFYAAYATNPKFRDHLSALGLHIHDAEMFFNLLSTTRDEDEDEVGIDAFVACCLKLRGVATSLDLQHVEMQIKHLHRAQRQFNKDYISLLKNMDIQGIETTDRVFRQDSTVGCSAGHPVRARSYPFLDVRSTQNLSQNAMEDSDVNCAQTDHQDGIARPHDVKDLSLMSRACRQDEKRAFIRAALLCSSCPWSM